MKLEVGKFVRTKAGMIAKIISKYNVSGSLHKDEIVFILDNGNKLALHSRKVIKASNNIIDILEEGDYVNGHRVDKVVIDPKCSYVLLEEVGCYVDSQEDIADYEIKSIVTKEQFSQMQYKVD